MEDKSSFLFSQSGKEIPIERLKSVPGAIRCVACEGKKQRKELSSVREEFSAAYKKISPAFKEARNAWKHAVEKILSEEAGYSVSLSQEEADKLTEGTLLRFETFLEFFFLAVKKF